MVKFGGGRRRNKMERARKTNRGAGKASTAGPTLGTLLQVRQCRDDSIEEIVLELGSLYNVRWDKEASVRAAMAEEKLGNGRALRSR